MDMQIILVYCLCADLLKALHHQEDVQCQMSDAEVMTAGIVAALFLAANTRWPARSCKNKGICRQ